MSKTAKEMFQELGYKRLENSPHNITYEKMHDTRSSKYVMFNKNNKIYVTTLDCTLTGEVALFVTKKLHKAIHQQMKELGWLDDSD